MFSNGHLRNINPRLSTFTFENCVKFVLCHLHFTSHMFLLISSLFLPFSKPFTYIPMPDLLALCNVPAFHYHMLKSFWADLVIWMNSSWCITCNIFLLFKRWPELVCITTRDRIQNQHTHLRLNQRRDFIKDNANPIKSEGWTPSRNWIQVKNNSQK